MSSSEGLLICPFERQLVEAGRTVLFSFRAKTNLYPPYRLLLHGDIRDVVLVRKLWFDGKSVSESDAPVPAMCGEIFGPLLLPFRGPPCPAWCLVTMDVDNQSIASIWVSATLLASSVPVPANVDPYLA